MEKEGSGGENSGHVLTVKSLLNRPRKRVVRERESVFSRVGVEQMSFCLFLPLNPARCFALVPN